MRIFCPSSTLRRLHELSDKTHVLVEEPQEADMILVIFPWKDGKQVEVHEMVDRFPDKCFAVSTTDLPGYLAHGVYTGASGLVSKIGNRIRTGGYNLENPFVENEKLGSARDFSKKYFCSFIGRNSHPVRQTIFHLKYQRSDILIEDSSHNFDLWDKNLNKVDVLAAQERFCDVLKRSKFALCPGGVCPNSIRLFEALKLGVAPVIFSDDWRFPLGPNWKEFCIVIRSKDVSELEHIVGEYEQDYREMGGKAASAYANWFSEQAYFNFLVNSCADIAHRQWVPERVARFIIKRGYGVETAYIETRKRLGLRSRLKRLLNIEDE